jgi:hypothetical protein
VLLNRPKTTPLPRRPDLFNIQNYFFRKINKYIRFRLDLSFFYGVCGILPKWRDKWQERNPDIYSDMVSGFWERDFLLERCVGKKIPGEKFYHVDVFISMDGTRTGE